MFLWKAHAGEGVRRQLSPNIDCRFGTHEGSWGANIPEKKVYIVSEKGSWQDIREKHY